MVVNIGGDLLKSIGLDQGDPGSLALAANNRGVVSRREKRSDKGRFPIVGRNELDGADRLNLRISPVIVEPDDRSISVVKFDRRIRQRVGNPCTRQTRTNGPDN